MLDQTIVFKSNNNIISKNNINDLMDLKILIKIFCFQKELFDIIKNGNKIINNKEKIFLINNKTIKKYKNYFEYNILYDYLINNNELLKKILSKHKEINHEKIDDKLLDKLIKNIPENYIEKIKKLNNIEKLIFDNNDKKLNIIEKSMSFFILFSYKIKYISDFEIVNEDIINLFIEKNIIQKSDIIESEYVINSGKIIIYFSFENNNFYEIGNIDSKGEFIIEYLIEEKYPKFKNDIINKINKYEIQNILGLNYTDKSSNEIKNEKDELIGYIYKIEEENKNKINIQNNNNNNENKINECDGEEFINNIISMIVSIFSFNFEIIKNIEYYKNKNFSNKIFHFQSFLINKTFISDLKNLCFYTEIFEICQKETNQCDLQIPEDVKNIIINEIKEKNNGYYTNNILKNKDKIIKLISYNNFTNLSLNEYKNNKKIILYPDNFEIVNKDAYSNIVNILLNFGNIEYESNLQTSLIINSGKIIIKPNEIQFLDQPNIYFLYLYSLKNEKNGNLDYIPEIVFKLYTRNCF